jgi:hypothetical protein
MPSIPRPGVHFFFPEELLINKCIVNNQSMNTVDSITGDVTYNIWFLDPSNLQLMQDIFVTLFTGL